MQSLLFALGTLLGFFPPASPSLPPQTALPVGEIIEGVPDDLTSATLLIPRYDFVRLDELPDGAPPNAAKRINAEAKKGNTTINEMALKGYQHGYKLVSMSDLDTLKTMGYRYYMDMVLMPKQMKYPKPEAMVPSWEKYGTANRMYRNRYSQFQYYFYIRDLETNNAYITTKFRGTAEVYTGMLKFFKQVSKDVASSTTVPQSNLSEN